MSESPPAAPQSATRPASVACLTAALFAAAALSFFRILEPDVFWHLKTGQVILETGRLVQTNLFSSTFPDQPWHNMEWLFQVVIALCHKAFGWGGVMGLKLILVLAMAAVLTRTLLRRAADPLLAAAVAVFVLALMRPRLTERPHLVTYLIFALLVWVVERRGAEGRPLWVLPPLFALWSNVHPELSLGLVYLGATVAGDWLDGRRGGAALPAGALRRRLLALGASTAATLANPEGWRVLLLPLGLVDPAVRIVEFRHSTPTGEPLFFALAGAVAALALLRRAGRSWSSLLPLAARGVVGAVYVRAAALFALAAAPFVHEGLAWLARGGSPPARRRIVRAAAGATALVALGWAFVLDRGTPYRWGYGPDEELFPAAAANFILASGPPPNLFHHYNVGGYLIFRLYPRQGVFQDGRGPYPAAFLRSMERHDRESLRRLFGEYRVNSALVSTAEAGLLFPAAEWGLVFWDPGYAVLVRRVAANAPFLGRNEYRAFLPGRPLPQDRGGLLRAVAEMRRNQQERLRADWSLSLSTAIALLRLRDLAGAEQEMLRAVATAPREPEAWAYLSMVRSLLGKGAEAAAAARRARELDPRLEKIGSVLGTSGG